MLLNSGCQHQLDSVELIDFRGARVVVDRDNVCLRVAVAQRAEHTLSNDVVRQACEWLRADDVRTSVFDHVDHLSREVPAFTCLVTEARDVLRTRDHLFDIAVGFELPIRLFEGAMDRNLILLEEPQSHGQDLALFAVDTQILVIPLRGRNRIVEELHESGKLSLTALSLDDVNRVVIRIGVELHEDLSHQPNARFTRNITQFQGVKLSNAALDQCRIAQAPR